MNGGQLKIDLLGTSFTIQADENADYLRTVLAYLTKKIDAIQSAVAIDDPLKVSIIAAFELVDELFKERRRSGSPVIDQDEVEAITVRLLNKLNRL
jgi:cell division protein ZapA (FtsZ GTPase activity inhibitor)